MFSGRGKVGGIVMSCYRLFLWFFWFCRGMGDFSFFFLGVGVDNKFVGL